MEPEFRRRKGGMRQRLSSHAASEHPVMGSLLANFLLEQFSWGFMSPQLVQKISMLAMKDINNAASTGCILKSLEQLSKLGGTGHLANNMHRDIRQFQSMSSLPVGLEVQLPFENVGFQTQSIMLPHELFSSLYHSYPAAWAEAIMPTPEKLEEFWNAQETHPNMEGNPIKMVPNYKSRCLPLGLHGDEVPITGKGKIWAKSMLTFQWTSLLGSGWSASRMMWIWGGFDKLFDNSATGTLSVFWKVLAWSFFWLQQGKWPTHDWQGQQYAPDSPQGEKAGSDLAGGFCASIWALMGDLDYFAKTLQLPRSTSHNPCCLCKCTLNGASTWKDNGQGAQWLGLFWKPLQWMAWEGRSKIDLFSIPGVSAVTVALDYMHSKYLGSDQYQYGGVLYVLCYLILPNNPKQNLAACWTAILAYYKQHNTKHRYQSITKLTMFVRKSGVIKMRGKAAEVKGFGPALLHLWESHMNNSLEIHKKIKLMLKLNCKIEEILDTFSDEIKLPTEFANKLAQHSFAMFQLQKEIHQHFQQDPDCTKSVFSLTGKIHMVLHSILLSGTINPKLVWCFMGEDFMRKIQKLGESCVRGMKSTAVSQKMVEHYRLALHLFLEALLK